jgi:hypothetical protein
MTLRVRTIMKSNSNQRNREALQHFLEDLIRHERHPDKIELITEILESLQHAPRWTLPSPAVRSAKE